MVKKMYPTQIKNKNQNYNDLDTLMYHLKEKVVGSKSTKQIPLLTLVPDKWSIIHTERFFKVHHLHVSIYERFLYCNVYKNAVKIIPYLFHQTVNIKNPIHSLFCTHIHMPRISNIFRYLIYYKKNLGLIIAW